MMTPQHTFDTTLRCVALPVVDADIGTPLEELLTLWADPRFAPTLNAETPRPHLLLVVNNANDASLAKARDIYLSLPELSNHFSGFTARSADLKGHMDRYERKPRGRVATFGARAGPNFQFFKTMEMAEEYGGFTLQIELDCLPVQAGWVEATQRVINGHASAWVIGSVYAGEGELKRNSQTHMNGNAIYRTGDPLFQSFIAEVWQPRLLRRIKQDYTLPYDCWWALERSEASALEANESWKLFQAFDSFMQSDPFVVNLLCKPSDAQAYMDVLERFMGLGQAPVFFHGAAMSPLRRQLIENPDDNMRDGMDRLTGQTGTRLRSYHFATGSRKSEGTDGNDVADDLPVGQTLLRATAAQMLAQPEVAPEPLSKNVMRSRDMLGETSPVVRYFDRALAFAIRRNDT